MCPPLIFEFGHLLDLGVGEWANLHQDSLSNSLGGPDDLFEEQQPVNTRVIPYYPQGGFGPLVQRVNRRPKCRYPNVLFRR